jgi:cobalt-precorrin-5B (C1)-methyltransferase
MARRPELSGLAFIQAADFFAYSLQQASEHGFSEIVWGCFFGKLVKMAQGLAYTHAHEAPTDFGLLAELAGQAGADERVRSEIFTANTARHALELIPEGEVRERFVERVVRKALSAARDHVGPGPRTGICCFGFDETVLAEAYTS